MALTVEAMVERLKAVEARYPETAAELEPVIQALTGPQAITVGTETARRLLGLGSVNTVKHWLELGILPGEREEHSGR